MYRVLHTSPPIIHQMIINDCRDFYSASCIHWIISWVECHIVGLHGAETWTLLKEDSRWLQAFHMTCQRRILGIRWNDFITNRTVSDSTNLRSILSTIAAHRHSIFGQIRRLPDRTPAHMTLKLAVNTRSGDTPHHGWNHPAGRPRTTWMSQIVRDSGLSADDAWAVAEDWSTWRALRPTAGYAQQWVSEWMSYRSSQWLIYPLC